MNLEEKLCKDSLRVLQTTYPHLESGYEVFMADVMQYAHLKREYADIMKSHSLSKLQVKKVLSIQEIIHSKEQWYVQEIYGVLDVLKEKTMHAKQLSQYRGVLVDGAKLQKIYGYIPHRDTLMDKHDKIMSYCESQIENYQPTQYISTQKKTEVTKLAYDIGKVGVFALTLPIVGIYELGNTTAKAYNSLSLRQKNSVKRGSSRFLAILMIIGSLGYGIKSASSALSNINLSWPSSREVSAPVIPLESNTTLANSIPYTAPIPITQQELSSLDTLYSSAIESELLVQKITLKQPAQINMASTLSKKEARQLKRKQRKLERKNRKKSN